MTIFKREGDAWDRLDPSNARQDPISLVGEVADGVLNIRDPNNALAWVELDLPSRHAVFNVKTVR